MVVVRAQLNIEAYRLCFRMACFNSAPSRRSAKGRSYAFAFSFPERSVLARLALSAFDRNLAHLVPVGAVRRFFDQLRELGFDPARQGHRPNMGGCDCGATRK